MSVKHLEFYILPRFGQTLDKQWVDFRETFAGLGAIGRSGYFDESTNESTHALAGLTVGQIAKREEFRVYFDKDASTDEFKFQVNNGTDDVPVWADCLTIRKSDCRVTASGQGGLLSTGGFYNLGGLDLELQGISGGAAFANVGTLLFDSTSGFYFSSDSAGRPVVAINVAAASGTVTQGASVGSGSSVFKEKVASTLNFRSLTAGSNITLTQNANDIEIAASSTGEANTGSSLGGGAEVFESKSGVDLRFRSVVGGDRVTVTEGVNEITIEADDLRFYGVLIRETEAGGFAGRSDQINFDSTHFYLSSDGSGKPVVSLVGSSGSGETNTASNLGAGEGIFSAKVGVDLQFKSLVAGTNVTLSSDANTITVNSTASGGGAGNAFYGVTFRESESGGYASKNDTLTFDSSYFYLESDALGKPVVSWAGNVGSKIQQGAFSGLATGLLEGGAMRIESEFYSDRIEIGAGVGVIVDHTRPDTPVATRVTWPVFRHVSIPNAESVLNYFFITSAGTLEKLTTPTVDDFQDKIYVGLSANISGGTLVRATNNSQPAYAVGNSFNEFARNVIGPAKIGGILFSANASANLTFDRSAGQAFALGCNLDQDVNRPNLKDTTAASPVASFFRAQRTNPGDSETLTATVASTIDPNNYDNDGTLTAVTTNRWTIQRIFFFPARESTAVFYGRTTFANKAAAVAGIQTETFNESTVTSLGGAILAAYLVVQQGATDLTNTSQAEFFQAPAFRISGAGGFSAGASVGIGVENDGNDGESTQFTNVAALAFNRDGGFYLAIHEGNQPQVNFHDHVETLSSTTTGDESLIASDVNDGIKAGHALTLKRLTAGTGISFSSDADQITITNAGAGGDVMPGFYGVVFRESEAGGAVYRTDGISFDSDFFYLSTGGDGKPLLSFSAALGGGGSSTVDVSQVSSTGVAKTFVDVDNISFNSDSGFYLTENTAGAPQIDFHDHVEELVSSSTGDESLISSDVATNAGHTLTLKRLTAGSGVTFASDADQITISASGGGGGSSNPGFYGVVFRETEAGGAAIKSDAVSFDSNFFYVSQGGDGKPIVSYSGSLPGLVHLASYGVVPSNPVSSIDMVGVMDASLYRYYKVFFTLIPETDTSILALRTSSNNGIKWDQSAGDYTYSLDALRGTSSIRVANSTTTVDLRLTAEAVGANEGEFCSGSFEISSVGDGVSHGLSLNGQVVYFPAFGATNASTDIHGFRNDFYIMNAVQLLFDAGNIERGTVDIYGYTY